MYFPISGATIDPFYLIGLGFIIGILGGFFGVGGSFLAGPALFVAGVPMNFRRRDRSPSHRRKIDGRRAQASHPGQH